MKFSSGAKRQIEINHKVSNKEQTKMNKKHTKNSPVIEKSTASILLWSYHPPTSKW